VAYGSRKKLEFRWRLAAARSAELAVCGPGDSAAAIKMIIRSEYSARLTPRSADEGILKPELISNLVRPSFRTKLCDGIDLDIQENLRLSLIDAAADGWRLQRIREERAP